MRTLLTSTALLTVAFLSAGAFRLDAKEHCCNECGCSHGLRKVCRLVCETEEVAETEFSCKCEDFCVPCPSDKCGTHCECDCKSHHGVSCKTIWKPSPHAEVRTRKLLVIKEVKKEVPQYRWVVEYVCDGCGCGDQTAPADAAPEAPLPTAEPAPPARRSIMQTLFQK